jgi:uncharacterized protein YecE (DUF72 family)
VRARVGCSGWNYKSWRERFYPRGLPPARWLAYYADHFDTVEVNNTFYRLPERSTFAMWRDRVPASFLMTVKASRFLTHMKRLREPEEPLRRLFSRASALERHLGPVLYQLPASFHRDLTRLDAFLDALPRIWSSRRVRHVMEFRHPSWYVSETMASPFVYVRFHGTSGRYHGSYSNRVLDVWARRLAEQVQNRRAVFAYFNNDPDAVAVDNALYLRGAIAKLISRNEGSATD